MSIYGPARKVWCTNRRIQQVSHAFLFFQESNQSDKHSLNTAQVRRPVEPGRGPNSVFVKVIRRRQNSLLAVLKFKMILQ